jgi:hypothetical protein
MAQGEQHNLSTPQTLVPNILSVAELERIIRRGKSGWRERLAKFKQRRSLRKKVNK